MVDLHKRICRLREAPPEPMDWCPTTPPPSRPIYPEGYRVGELPPTTPSQTSNAFARPASPFWSVSDSKRTCPGLRKTGRFAWATTQATSIGAGRLIGIGLQRAGKQALRGSRAAPTSAHTCTARIIHNWQINRPRDNKAPRPERAITMKARENIDLEKRHRVAEELKRKLAPVYQPCPTKDMIWAPHFDENGRFNPNEIFLGYRAPKESAIFPADTPDLQIERELVAAIPLSHRFMQTHRHPRPKGRVGTLNNRFSGVGMTTTRDRKASGPGIFDIDHYAEDNEKRAHAACNPKPNSNTTEEKVNETLETHAESITIGTLNVSEQGAANILSWIGGTGNAPPSPPLQSVPIEQDLELTPFEKRRKMLAVRKANRSASSPNKEAPVNMSSSYSPQVHRGTSIKAQRDASLGVPIRSFQESPEPIPKSPEPGILKATSSPTPQKSPELARIPLDQSSLMTGSRASQKTKSPDVVRKIEESRATLSVRTPAVQKSPTSPKSVQQAAAGASAQSKALLSDISSTCDISPLLSDISSTCDISPLPDYHPAPPVADAVDLQSTLLPPKVASQAPSPRISPSADAHSLPGGWIEDQRITVAQDAQANNNGEISNVFIKTPARRLVSMPIRGHGDIKEDEIRTPERAENDTPKANSHGTTRKTLKDRIAERQAEAEAQKKHYTITPLSQYWDDKVEELLSTGINSTGVKDGGLTAYDLGRCAPPKDKFASHDNWLNDEVINKYLKMVADFGVQLSGRSIEKTTSHFAFNSFFYNKLADARQGIKSIARWVSRARINGQRLLDVEMLFVPINSRHHWTLAVVSGTNKTITYYDSLGGNGQNEMRILLNWVQSELGKAFVASDWQLITGSSGMQANLDDCGVFTITNARQLTLGMVPHETFGPQQAQIQRRRIVAELANGALLVAGS